MAARRRRIDHRLRLDDVGRVEHELHDGVRDDGGLDGLMVVDLLDRRRLRSLHADNRVPGVQ